ncbi:Hypothetical_protein [Hexamita inflata]|uniref:Hypothetical_protein n=1 Tax=Hexamita inflata TaxID=28002 RepID=A0AA86TR06_9EUKA|nr:Hypothetical protein HINF_LOCUS11176 [Hexamita inflata]CAI9923532.1 Hypothetical protein HINF_LOCUS11177 [Hexamita inflata]CAI9954083.1 Hypothetical protein HINF_LOCUS41728 [Hexamita inflata]
MIAVFLFLNYHHISILDAIRIKATLCQNKYKRKDDLFFQEYNKLCIALSIQVRSRELVYIIEVDISKSCLVDQYAVYTSDLFDNRGSTYVQIIAEILECEGVLVYGICYYQCLQVLIFMLKHWFTKTCHYLSLNGHSLSYSSYQYQTYCQICIHYLTKCFTQYIYKDINIEQSKLRADFNKINYAVM